MNIDEFVSLSLRKKTAFLVRVIRVYRFINVHKVVAMFYLHVWFIITKWVKSHQLSFLSMPFTVTRISPETYLYSIIPASNLWRPLSLPCNCTKYAYYPSVIIFEEKGGIYPALTIIFKDLCIEPSWIKTQILRWVRYVTGTLRATIDWFKSFSSPFCCRSF